MGNFPGLDVDVDSIPSHPAYPTPKSEADLFPTALFESPDFRTSATTLRERRWQEVMNQITDKSDWHEKIRDKEIQAKWKGEVLVASEQNREGFSTSMADAMIAELLQKAKDFEKNHYVVTYDPGVVKSDHVISESLKRELQNAVKPLENVSDSAKDWHPGSDNKVLDLVHPSLWPLIYGVTKILDEGLECDDDPIADIGVGNTLPGPTEKAVDWSYSKTFQWLPADLDYNEAKEAKFVSYINNLHPQKHQGLYTIIEKIINATIPLWNRTLYSWPVQQRISYDHIEYHDLPKIDREEGEEDDDYEDRAYDALEEIKPEYIVQPEPHGKPLKYEIKDIREEFSFGIQVIVKLANIHLKPGESYEGGSWHVEGQANEHIVASALYYYDSENITESRLAFRRSCDEEEFNEIDYEQGDHAFLPGVYGLNNYEPAVQDVGSVICKEGRLLTFPNTLQHCVSPFELEDKSKSGHRKILALFLVDPHLRIMSTRDIPPQQKDWWMERLLQTKGIKFIDKLPPEIVNHILSFVDDPMSLETAKEWRLKLMEERSHYVKEQNGNFEEQEYNLCEH